MNNSGIASSSVQALNRPRPIIAIIGRPNVGKSTLFNRLIGARWAIINDQPGVTRDLIYAEAEWDAYKFTLVDSGGYIPRSNAAITTAVRAQAEQAIEEADIVILLGDITTGPTDIDREVAQLLLQQKCPSMLAVNKVDEPERGAFLHEFYHLGLGEPVPVSAASGRLSGDFLAYLTKRFAALFQAEHEEVDAAVKVVLAGRPNVGKSTLINRLAGHRISSVHDQPGTTRDTTQIRLAWKEQEFILMDTAGLRRRAKIQDPIEYYSGLRASSSIDRADVGIALIDASEGVTIQDIRIINQVIEAGCGLVIAVNKWDLAANFGNSSLEFSQNFFHKYPFLKDFPLIFISGLTGKRVFKCLENVGKVYANYTNRIATGPLNRLVESLSANAPPAQGGREIKLLYATQHTASPPTFVFFSNYPDLVSNSYKRFLEKNLRANFDLHGTPIRMVWRKRRA